MSSRPRRKNIIPTVSRKLLVSGIAASTLAGAGLFAKAAPSVAGQASSAVSLAAADSTTNSLYAYKTHAWDGAEPVNVNGSWTFQLAAMNSAPTRRRSELWWGRNGSPVSYREGSLAVFTGDLGAALGAAGKSQKDWHVLHQLIGTTYGQWKGPAVSLVVSGGELRVTGGIGHPDHGVGGRTYYWHKQLAAFNDYQRYKVRLEVFLTSNPDNGWVSAWIDGKQILDKYKPVSKQGLRPSTLYPGTPEVYARSGLYRGTDGATPPSYWQAARIENVVIG